MAGRGDGANARGACCDGAGGGVHDWGRREGEAGALPK